MFFKTNISVKALWLTLFGSLMKEFYLSHTSCLNLMILPEKSTLKGIEAQISRSCLSAKSLRDSTEAVFRILVFALQLFEMLLIVRLGKLNRFDVVAVVVPT
jgi:hypothetical protein